MIDDAYYNVKDPTYYLDDVLAETAVAEAEKEPPEPHVLKTVLDEQDGGKLEVHYQHHPHDHAHVDLMKEEYLPDEVARMLGTSVEVIMHAIWHGELKARRSGHHIVYISRAALVEWYKARI